MLVLNVFLKRLKVIIFSVIEIVHTQKNIKDHIPYSFAYKVVYIDNKFSKKVVLYRGKNAVDKFINSILNEYNYCRTVIKNISVRI